MRSETNPRRRNFKPRGMDNYGRQWVTYSVSTSLTHCSLLVASPLNTISTICEAARGLGIRAWTDEVGMEEQFIRPMRARGLELHIVGTKVLYCTMGGPCYHLPQATQPPHCWRANGVLPYCTESGVLFGVWPSSDREEAKSRNRTATVTKSKARQDGRTGRIHTEDYLGTE
jgi:hypothetical protein